MLAQTEAWAPVCTQYWGLSLWSRMSSRQARWVDPLLHHIDWYRIWSKSSPSSIPKCLLLRWWRLRHDHSTALNIEVCIRGVKSRAGRLDESIRCYIISSDITYDRNQVDPAFLIVCCYAGADWGMSTPLHPISRFVFAELNLEPAG